MSRLDSQRVRSVHAGRWSGLSATVRVLDWETTGQGRRLHDLRHTAACLWLSHRVEPGTVQAWCGHESIATTNRYLHFLGTDADKAGLDKLNDGPGSAGVHAMSERGHRTQETPPNLGAYGLVGRGLHDGAACGNRTHDLLITSETLYRLS
jgi:hypothetical protein